MAPPPQRFLMSWIKSLLSRSTQREILFAKAKDLPPPQLDGLVKEALRYPQLRPYLLGHVTPTLSELGRATPTPNCTDLEAEVNWTVTIIRRSADVLQRLLEL